MLSALQPEPTLYEFIEALPEGLTGELLDGQLHTQPQPSGAHMVVGSVLGSELLGPFQRGIRGPGGWWIIDEPEVHFVRNVEVAVPDLAGWRRERMPYPPVRDHRFEVVPDWICEIFSPSTRSRDREVKMPLYAYYKVPYVWLIDPIKRTLEAYRLEAGAWTEVGRFADTDQVAIPPFEAVSLDLSALWPPQRPVIV
ncbi:MAG: Uma2 family endonuclease [Candidatus Thiosymbion ectosymbiont of Robbea hypermnestra]|nr:Uma2 family endonuclease [Candidatus Thiosymbion ectosymbiont of Robbea hypermnestra]